MSNIKVLALIFAFLCPAFLFADQIVLKNRDRLTGTIEKSDDKTLLIKTEFAGEVTVKWPAVQEITSTQSLHVSLSDGKTVVGTVTTSDGNLAVTTSNAGTVNEPIANVTKLFGEAEEAAYEKSLHPGMLEGWKGGANVGFGLTRGNSQTKSLDIAFTADRKTLHDHLGLYTNSVYATNDAPGATPPRQRPTRCRADFATTMISLTGFSHTWAPISRPTPSRPWIFAPSLAAAWVCT